MSVAATVFRRWGAPVAVLTWLAFAPSAGAASLEADYRFDDNLNSSIAGTPALTLEGPGPVLYEAKTIGGIGDRVLTFPEGTGLRLDPPASVNRSDYSVITTFEFDALFDYQRILAFEPIAALSDDGLYSYSDYLDFYYKDHSSIEYEGPVGALALDTFADLTFTRAADKTAKAYVGDTEQISFSDTFDAASIGSDGLRFFKDNGSEESAGSVARIRIYNGVLTPAEIATIRATGGLAATGAVSAPPKLNPSKPKKAKKIKTGITAACPDEAVPCSVDATITRAKAKKGVPPVLGNLSAQIDPGTSTGPVVDLTKKARKAIAKKGKIAIDAEVTITPSSGSPVSFTSSGKI
jgi:hypothetical protein